MSTTKTDHPEAATYTRREYLSYTAIIIREPRKPREVMPGDLDERLTFAEWEAGK